MTIKKITIVAAIVAAVGFSAYLGLRPTPTSALTELQLANAEALSTDEVIIIEYDKNCLSKGDICVKGPTWVIYDSDPYNP